MSIAQDRAFYERRLREEQARASNASDETLRNLHLQWASLYASRLALVIADLEPASGTDGPVAALNQ